MNLFYKILLLCVVLAFLGCQEEVPQTELTEKPVPAEPVAEVEQAATPPTPPMLEDFQSNPKLSLFPRVGDFRPANEDDRLPYWKTFIDHLAKVTGVVESPEDGNRAWSFRSINTVDSLGYFSPLAVEPATRYQVSFKLKAELPEEASAGIGIIEFNEFLWIGEQYSEETFNKHYRGVHEGVRLTGNIDWEEHSFTFTTGPETQMIHIILFREGAHERSGVLYDDIKIEVVGNE